MGMYCQLSVASEDSLSSADSSAVATSGLSLEKAWHGLHYLLTGEVWEGNGPLAFLLTGGEPLGDEEEGTRWITPTETAEIHRALSGITDDQLWSRFDADAMEQQEVYPGIWDEPEAELKEEYLSYFGELKQLVAEAAQGGQGLLVSIG